MDDCPAKSISLQVEWNCHSRDKCSPSACKDSRAAHRLLLLGCLLLRLLHLLLLVALCSQPLLDVLDGLPFFELIDDIEQRDPAILSMILTFGAPPWR